jgi:superfamily II DNA helicase RecQ
MMDYNIYQYYGMSELSSMAEKFSSAMKELDDATKVRLFNSMIDVLLPYVDPEVIGTSVTRDPITDQVVVIKVHKPPKETIYVPRSNKLDVDIAQLNTEELKIYDELRKWRNDLSKLLQVPAYTICNNSTLVNIAHYKPQNNESLLTIKGIGPTTAEKYGEDLIGIVKSASKPAKRLLTKEVKKKEIVLPPSDGYESGEE